MRLPEPVPGMVISYSYLWLREKADGHEEGRKDRPCVVVASVVSVGGTRRALVVPVTHSLPDALGLAVELPIKVKRRLGLDEARSWIVVSEWNDFIWPGPDVRRVRGRESINYGMLPPALFEIVRKRLLAAARSSTGVSRT